MWVLWALLAGASAKDCPWEGDAIESVQATMTTASVNGRTWSVEGRDNRLRFRGWLVACRHAEAAQHFTAWRSARLGTNVAAASVVGLVVTPFSAAFAGIARDDFVRALGAPVVESSPRSAAPDGLIGLRRERVLAFYALSESDRMVRADTPRRVAPALAAHFDSEWAPFHTVQPTGAVLATLESLGLPEAEALADWLRDQDTAFVGWHLERTHPDDGDRPSDEALADQARVLVFHALPTPSGPPVDGAPRLVLEAELPSLGPLDPDVPPHLTIATAGWLRTRLSGSALVVDQVSKWLEDHDPAYVGWWWAAPTEP